MEIASRFSVLYRLVPYSRDFPTHFSRCAALVYRLNPFRSDPVGWQFGWQFFWPTASAGRARGLLAAMGGLTKARLDRRGWDRGDLSRRAAACRGLTASGQNITLSLRKSCAPLVAAMEGRKGMPPETTSRRFPPPWTIDRRTTRASSSATPTGGARILSAGTVVGLVRNALRVQLDNGSYSLMRKRAAY